MSNFLQRIASTVSGNATSRLHPMLGSIFAPAAPLTHFEAPAAVVVPISSKTFAYRPRGHEQAGSPLHLRQAPLLGPSVFREPDATPGPGHAPYPSGTDAPLLPQHDVNAAPETALLSRSSMRERVAPHDAAAGTESPTADLPVPVPASQRPQPLLAAAILSPSRIAPARTAPEAPQRRPPGEPDEIHIHIGRIEVAAVAPPTPRPASAQVRKSLSLEEYLRRGNGRQG
jgi:hypothetical protein